MRVERVAAGEVEDGRERSGCRSNNFFELFESRAIAGQRRRVPESKRVYIRERHVVDA